MASHMLTDAAITSWCSVEACLRSCWTVSKVAWETKPPEQVWALLRFLCTWVSHIILENPSMFSSWWSTLLLEEFFPLSVWSICSTAPKLTALLNCLCKSFFSKSPSFEAMLLELLVTPRRLCSAVGLLLSLSTWWTPGLFCRFYLGELGLLQHRPNGWYWAAWALESRLAPSSTYQPDLGINTRCDISR